MFKVTVKVKGIDKAIQAVDKSIAKNDVILTKLAEDTKNYMKELIYARRRGGKRVGKSNLAERINSERIKKTDRIIYGVGRISKLPKYWNDANVGFAIPGKKFGFFEGYRGPNPDKAGTGVGDEKFTSARDGFYLKPKFPSKPLNYIEDTYFWISTVFYTRF